jgi:hypothetical protein
MKKFIALTALLFLGLLMTAIPSCADQASGTQISKIIEYKATLGLTDSQVKKLDLVQRTAQQKMDEAKGQADIRLTEIERFTSNWSDMNSIAVMSLIKEYFGYLANYKSAELEAIIRARAILSMDQLNKFQQIVSIQTMILKMEPGLAAK